MLSVTLYIHDGQTEYVYDDARLLASSIVSEERVDGAQVQLSNLEMLVGPDDNQDRADIAAVQDLRTLNDGYYNLRATPPYWRAKVEGPSGDVLLDGVVPYNELEWDDAKKSWKVRVINQANHEFWAELEQWNLLELQEEQSKRSDDPAQVTEQLKVWEEGDEQTPYEKTDVTVKQLTPLLKNLLGRLDIDYTVPAQVSYQSSDLWAYMGRWRMDRFVRQVARLAGWRVRPSFRAWPSGALEVEFVQSGWPGRSPGFRTIDSEQVAPYRSWKEYGDNFSISLQNETCQPSSNPIEYAQKGSDLNGDIPTFAPPLPYQIDAPLIWEADAATYGAEFVVSDPAPVLDPRSMQTEEESLRWRNAEIDIVGNTTGVNEWHYGRPLIQRKPSVLGTRTQAFDVEAEQDAFAYLFELYEDGSGDVWAKHHSAFTDEFGDAWAAGGQWERYGQHYGPRQYLNGEWQGLSGIRVGDPLKGVSMINEDWIVTERRRKVDTDVDVLTLSRPTTDYSRAATPPPLASQLSTQPWKVLGLQAEVQVIDTNGNGDEDWLLAHWERTPTQRAADWKYQVEVVDQSSSTTLFSGTTFETALAFQLASSGNSGGTYDLSVQVRAEDFDGDQGSLAFYNFQTTI